MPIVDEEFLRRVDPDRFVKAERNLKKGVITQGEYESAVGRGPAVLFDEIKADLTARITVEEFEARYGAGDKFWEEVKKLMVESDELWEFRHGTFPSGRSGVFILRGDEVQAHFTFGIS